MWILRLALTEDRRVREEEIRAVQARDAEKAQELTDKPVTTLSATTYTTRICSRGYWCMRCEMR